MEMVGATFTTCPFLGKWWIVNLLKTQPDFLTDARAVFAFWHILSSATICPCGVFQKASADQIRPTLNSSKGLQMVEVQHEMSYRLTFFPKVTIEPEIAKSIRSIALQRETEMWTRPFLNASSWPVSLFTLFTDSLSSRKPDCVAIHATLPLISVSPLLENKACPISILYAGVQLQTWTIRRAKPGPTQNWHFLQWQLLSLL